MFFYLYNGVGCHCCDVLLLMPRPLRASSLESASFALGISRCQLIFDPASEQQYSITIVSQPECPPWMIEHELCLLARIKQQYTNV